MTIDSHPPADYTAEQCANCVRLNDCRLCFERLLAKFESPVLHFLIRQGHRQPDAEDLLQETFLLAYRKRARYQSQWRFSTWLFTLAYRLSLSHKRRKTLKTIDSQQLPASPAETDPSHLATQAELRTNIWDTARKLLEPEAFTALWLRYAESLSAEEIGQVLGRSTNAVRILLHRASRAARRDEHQRTMRGVKP
jgi:RNA polymerase sigma-70 factor (ECF subfamily)